MSPAHRGAPLRHLRGAVAARVRSFVGHGSELFQRGKMRPTANASRAARPRRARAASQVRCRNIHKEGAIRLPPGRMSTIAAYDPSSRIGRARRTLQLVPLLIKVSSRVRMPRRWPCQIERPSWRASRARDTSPRTIVSPPPANSTTTTWVTCVLLKSAARSDSYARPSVCQSRVGTRSQGVMM